MIKNRLLELCLGCYTLKVMPFGLCNAPATFQRSMELILKGLNWTSCLVYLDDIIIFSKSIDEHLQRLKEVLSRLELANLKIKPEKCKLFQTSVKYLGHIVSDRGIHTDPEKVSTIQNWPQQANTKELRQFLGLDSYYRKFIHGFANQATPLYKLIEKNRCWTWTVECEEAFHSLKRSFCESPVLAYPDFMCPFRLDMDSSMCVLEAILLQKIKEGERVIAYASCTLSKTEKQYCATQREMLALVWACKCFRPYLLGQKFTVRTDHHALQWLTKVQRARRTGGSLAGVSS